MQITVLVAGPGGRAFVAALLARQGTDSPSAPSAAPDPRGGDGPGGTSGGTLTLVANTAEDITLAGLRVCPDLDALCDVLAGPEPPAGSGSRAMLELLQGYDAAPTWYPLDDACLARGIARSRGLGTGSTLSEITAHILDADRSRSGAADRGPATGASATTPSGSSAQAPQGRSGVTLLPMSDQPVESHVVVQDGDGERARHALEWALAHDDEATLRVTAAGLRDARPAPGVLDAVRGADVVFVPLTAPLTGLGVMLGLPGVRDALRGTAAPVVGIGPELLPARGDEERTLAPLGLEYRSSDVVGLVADALDGVLVPASEWVLTEESHRGPVVDGVGGGDVRPEPGEVVRAALDLAARIGRSS